MPLANQLIILFWLIFILYWAVSAVGVKKDITKNRTWWSFFIARVLIIIAIIWAINSGIFSGLWVSAVHWSIFTNIIANIIGVVLCGIGIAFAIWARRHIGRNWSGTPQMKEGHELVTSGPYRFVRHPIYTGMSTAIFGSALVAGPGWFVAFIIATVVFVLRIKTEEGYMMHLFPNQYPAYRARTKALIPFVW